MIVGVIFIILGLVDGPGLGDVLIGLGVLCVMLGAHTGRWIV